MNQAKLIELVTEVDCGTEIVREGDCRVFTVIERKLGVEVDRLYRERISSVEHSRRGVSVDVIVRGDLSKFLDDYRWDDDLAR